MRIGELAKRAGVSIATIKYYIREGLLPPAPRKTGRTMAWYDHDYLERLLLIRRLREEQFLPVRVIRAVLAEHGDEPLTTIEAKLLARLGDRVAQKLGAPAGDRDLSRFELTPDEQEVLEGMGLADPDVLEALEKMEAAGLTRDRFPLEGLGHYVELLGELARREVRLFLRRASAIPDDELESLAERAVDVTEPVLNLIRRRLILREIRRHKETP